jgi:hypothetical protein
LSIDVALVRSAVTGHTALLNVLVQDVGQLRQEMGGMRREMGELRQEMGTMRADIAAIRTALAPRDRPGVD